MSAGKYTFVLLAIAAVFLGVKAVPPQKIVEGQRADKNEFPYLVSIRLKPTYVHQCGGAIISRQHILTAAHCLEKTHFTDIAVVVGTNDISSGGSFYSLKGAAVHDHYRSFNADTYHRYDIAVLTLATPLKLSGLTWSSIKLASQEYAPGWPALVAGWGRTSFGSNYQTRHLLHLHTELADSSVCSRKILMDKNYHVCTLPKKGTGTCQGDSGGPLVVNDEVVGVVSYSENCGIYPSVFSKVLAYKNFIQRATGIKM